MKKLSILLVMCIIGLISNAQMSFKPTKFKLDREQKSVVITSNPNVDGVRAIGCGKGDNLGLASLSYLTFNGVLISSHFTGTPETRKEMKYFVLSGVVFSTIIFFAYINNR